MFKDEFAGQYQELDSRSGRTYFFSKKSAVCSRTGQQVILKKAENVPLETYHAKVEPKLRLFQRLEHPQAERVLEFKADCGTVVSVSHAVDYEEISLEAYLSSGREFTVLQAIEVVLTLADILAAAGELGAHHYELTPQFIMLARAESEAYHHGAFRVRLVDFDLALCCEVGEPPMVNMMVKDLKLWYTSPRRFQLQEPDDQSSMYIFAKIFFECLSGALYRFIPLRSHALKALYPNMGVKTPHPDDAQADEERPLLPLLTPDDLRAMPEGAEPELNALNQLIGRLMRDQPEDRPADWREVIDELSRVRESLEARLASNPETPPRQRKLIYDSKLGFRAVDPQELSESRGESGAPPEALTRDTERESTLRRVWSWLWGRR